jgi:hypothetical protein
MHCNPAEIRQGRLFFSLASSLSALNRRPQPRSPARVRIFRRGSIAAGLGVGFKTDVLICIPIAVVAICERFAPRSIAYRQRAAAVGDFPGSSSHWSAGQC